jgi:hypothetical protein
LLDDFPGYFPFEDEDHLSQLLRRAETEPDFYETLKDHVQQLAPKVDPENERAAWADLLEEFDLRPD